jgi:UDP-N-acetylglucosamine 2-epimerase
MEKLRLLSVFGTRPEVIKFAPVLNALRDAAEVESIIGVTGQHKEMLQQMLSLCHLQPDFDLQVMRPDQTLAELTARVLPQIDAYLQQYQPDRVLVQGDTTTGFATALACFYRQIPVGHIEAGLRSHNLYAPWPEEFNRRAISLVTDMHFAPTQQAWDYLKNENIPEENLYLTGNTVVDALHYFSEVLETHPTLSEEFAQEFSMLNPQKKLVLVTMHRRENFDGGIADICHALREIADRDEVEIYFPVHLNPHVRGPVQEILADHPSIHLGEPLDYLHFIYLMNRAYFIISDSGGVQEEGPSLRKPVLVLRETTERPEGVQAKCCELVGTDCRCIIESATKLLDNPSAYEQMRNAPTLYGDGKAAASIVEAILNRHTNREGARHAHAG